MRLHGSGQSVRTRGRMPKGSSISTPISSMPAHRQRFRRYSCYSKVRLGSMHETMALKQA